jgi:hypothetical protein
MNCVEIEQYPKTCAEYFSVLCALLKDYNGDSESQSRWSELMRKLVQLLIEHRVFEHSSSHSDTILIGLIILSN